MDYARIGMLIRTLRNEKHLTQKQLAGMLGLSDKTISKWERGLGLPDVSLITGLSDILGVNIKDMLKGGLDENSFEGGNMKKSKFYVCPICANVSICTGNAQISCCGRMLEPLEPKKAVQDQRLTVESVEDDWYVTSGHPMRKDNYISFLALVNSDRIQFVKQYPEWDLQCRFQKRGHGSLIWYSTNTGLFYQLI